MSSKIHAPHDGPLYRTAQRLWHFLLMKVLQHTPLSIRKQLFAGTEHYCPVCESPLRRFLVLKRDYHLWCPLCWSLPRHRLVWIFLQEQGLLDALPKDLLHIAPEPALVARFEALADLSLVTMDLYNPQAQVKMDITNIEFPDAHYDMVYCSHVLEHVSQDHKAISEMHRVLKATGCAVILVPITAKATYEDPSITAPAQREQHFGQHDHVRRYGPDIQERFEQAGFTTKVFRCRDLVDAETIAQQGLSTHDAIFLCTKQ